MNIVNRPYDSMVRAPPLRQPYRHQRDRQTPAPLGTIGLARADVPVAVPREKSVLDRQRPHPGPRLNARLIHPEQRGDLIKGEEHTSQRIGHAVKLLDSLI